MIHVFITSSFINRVFMNYMIILSKLSTKNQQNMYTYGLISMLSMFKIIIPHK